MNYGKGFYNNIGASVKDVEENSAQLDDIANKLDGNLDATNMATELLNSIGNAVPANNTITSEKMNAILSVVYEDITTLRQNIIASVPIVTNNIVALSGNASWKSYRFLKETITKELIRVEFNEDRGTLSAGTFVFYDDANNVYFYAYYNDIVTGAFTSDFVSVDTVSNTITYDFSAILEAYPLVTRMYFVFNNLDTPLVEMADKGTKELEWLKVSKDNIENYAITNEKLYGEISIDKLDATAGGAPTINLKDSYIATVGVEFNIYNRNVILCKNIEDYFVKWTITPTNTAFYPYAERLKFKPIVGDVGVHSITVEVYGNSLGAYGATPLASKTFTINVVANNSLTTAKNAIFIGDSLTDYNVFQKEIRNMVGTNFNLLGTRGIAPNLHEGRSGWTINNYFEESVSGVANPFYNPSTFTFDFSYYMANNYPATTIDYVNVFLGTNNGYSPSAIEGSYKAIIDSIRAYDVNIEITIMSAHFPAINNDGYAYVSHNSASFALSQASVAFTTKLYDTFSAYSKLHIIPIHINLDRLYDYPTVSTNVSDRNATVTIQRFTENVHPLNPEGFYKFSDVWYAYFQAIEQAVI